MNNFEDDMSKLLDDIEQDANERRRRHRLNIEAIERRRAQLSAPNDYESYRSEIERGT